MLSAAIALLGLATFASAFFGVRWLLLRQSALLAPDAPGVRRLHRDTTPRGGGLAIVVSFLAFGIAPFVLIEPLPIALVLAGFGVLIAISARDDHRPVGVGARLAVHTLAAILILAALWPELPGIDLGTEGVVLYAAGALALLALVWSINLHNFIDGINGMLAIQVAFVGALIASVPGVALDPTVVVPALVLTVACLGFLPFNFPRARVFMGDVGSAPLGLAVGLVLVMAVRQGHLPLAAALIVPVVVVTDTTLTLLSRLVRGRRWYRAHREHLYQWLVRAGASHRTVSLGYLLINLLVVAPLTFAALGFREHGALIALAAYALAAVAWILGKRAVLARVGAR